MKQHNILIKIHRWLTVLGLLLICLSKLVYAAPKQQALNFTPGLGVPITTAVADTAPKGSWGISERIEYYPAKKFSDAQLLEDLELESQNSYLINYVTLSYGVAENFTMGLSTYYINIPNIRGAFENAQTGEPMVVREGNSFGIGDTNWYGVWKLKEYEKSKLSIAALTGLYIPTGRTGARSILGELFAAADQPGQGAWSPLAGLIVSQDLEKFLWAINAIYTKRTEGTQHTVIGSTYTYSVAGVYELYKGKTNNLDGVLEFNGEFAYKDNIDGVVDNNSGGHTLYLTTGLRANMGKSVSLYVGYAYPVRQELNGNQLHYKFDVIGGIDITIG